jgi:hypothetical protein
LKEGLETDRLVHDALVALRGRSAADAARLA